MATVLATCIVAYICIEAIYKDMSSGSISVKAIEIECRRENHWRLAGYRFSDFFAQVMVVMRREILSVETHTQISICFILHMCWPSNVETYGMAAAAFAHMWIAYAKCWEF